MANILDRLNKHEENLMEEESVPVAVPPAEPDPLQEIEDRMNKLSKRRSEISNELGACIQRLNEIANGFVRANFDTLDDLAREYAALGAKKELLAHASKVLGDEYASLQKKGGQITTSISPREIARARRIRQLRFYLSNELETRENRQQWKKELDAILAEGGVKHIFVSADNTPALDPEPVSNNAGIETALRKHEESLRLMKVPAAATPARPAPAPKKPKPSMSEKEKERRWLGQRQNGRKN